ncbi:MAG: sigma-70 family RNA polymerase sigma factor [Oscillospiraceae bacterium]|nr:sigma-70 family RNA polymerase sigma factor [Oscillospiraceae bacterium]
MSNEELVAEIQAGAVELMGQLWDQVAGLIKWKAKRIMTVLEGCPGRGVEFEDLYQSGYLAMVAAVNTYDPAAGGAFSTWLMYHLKNAFAEATGYRTQKGRQEPLNNYLSLDTPLTDDADSDDLMDVVADPAGLQWRECLEESMWRKQLQEAVGAALSTVPEQYREILRLRYWEDMTLEDVGDLRGISKERVRQMENKGIRILRQPKTASQLYTFCDFDFYGGTGLGAFRYGGMSVQERYLLVEEERKERQSSRHRKDRENEIRNSVTAMMESITAETEARVAAMTPEEKERLLKLYGLA